jgi:glycosyltransferase involved in cell wall biosynthesis
MREQLATTPNVKILGRVDHDTIADYYRAADLLVHPTLIDGLPNVLLEAAACGTPSVARDVGDCSIAASQTFSETNKLPDLLMDEHEPVELRDRLDSNNLRARYVNAITHTKQH